MTKIIVNPVTGRMETVAEATPAATPESVREYRRQLREKLNPSGEGWHRDDLGPTPKPKTAPDLTSHTFPLIEDEA
jgi:hypothetical protein